MKLRDVVIFSGDQFTIPTGIQRIDSRSTHGWQVRYQGTKMFSDHSPDGSGAPASLAKATKELLSRIAKLPAPSLLQKKPSGSKSNDLPPGISGPIVRSRAGANLRTCSFSVLLPQFGGKPRCSTVYIGNENTYTPEKYQHALAKAVELRQAAEAAYERATTLARRRDGKAIKQGTLEHKAPKAAKPTKRKRRAPAL